MQNSGKTSRDPKRAIEIEVEESGVSIDKLEVPLNSLYTKSVKSKVARDKKVGGNRSRRQKAIAVEGGPNGVSIDKMEVRLCSSDTKSMKSKKAGDKKVYRRPENYYVDRDPSKLTDKELQLIRTNLTYQE